MLASSDDFLFTAKPDSHKALYDFMKGATFDAVSIVEKAGAKKLYKSRRQSVPLNRLCAAI